MYYEFSWCSVVESCEISKATLTDTTLADNIEHVSDTADASVTARSIDTVGVGGTFVGLLSAFVDVYKKKPCVAHSV